MQTYSVGVLAFSEEEGVGDGRTKGAVNVHAGIPGGADINTLKLAY